MRRATIGATDSFVGDRTGLAIPAHPHALIAAGPEFLAQAFRAFGAPCDVAAIASSAPCPGGSTGQKLFLDVAFADGSQRRLFAKFSRDFSDKRRDSPGRWEMKSEVPFAWLAQRPGFPIAVPRPWFADFDGHSGSGLIITDRVAFGADSIEPHREKTMDHQTLEHPLEHYRAVVTALARLAGAHKAGVLSPDIDTLFPFDPNTGGPDPIRYTREELAAELDRCFDFAARAPQLLPLEVSSPAFHETMLRDAMAVFDNAEVIRAWLTGNPDMIALDHWNAHIDNCWFQREANGTLACGLIDWGRVGQITFGSALWGGLSAAHHDIWDCHLEELLAVFCAEYRNHGGPAITPDALMLHLTLHMAAMGVARVLMFPEVIEFRLPECIEAAGPFDPMFERSESARNCLHVYTVFLKFWQRRGFAGALAQVLGE